MTKKKTTKKRRRVRKSAQPLQTLATIIIQPGNTIQDPGPLFCLRNAPVSWLVINQDAEPHVVSIDPGKIKHKNNNQFQHPFTGATHLKSARLENGETGVLWAMIAADFLHAREQYKYSIDSSGSYGTGSTLDPDLDVIEPSLKVLPPRRRLRKTTATRRR
jgi:hypothetical protein